MQAKRAELQGALESMQREMAEVQRFNAGLTDQVDLKQQEQAIPERNPSRMPNRHNMSSHTPAPPYNQGGISNADDLMHGERLQHLMDVHLPMLERQLREIVSLVSAAQKHGLQLLPQSQWSDFEYAAMLEAPTEGTCSSQPKIIGMVMDPLHRRLRKAREVHERFQSSLAAQSP
jgi:hypothetical protein